MTTCKDCTYFLQPRIPSTPGRCNRDGCYYYTATRERHSPCCDNFVSWKQCKEVFEFQKKSGTVEVGDVIAHERPEGQGKVSQCSSVVVSLRKTSEGKLIAYVHGTTVEGPFQILRKWSE